MATKLPKWARIRKLIDGRYIPEIRKGIWPFYEWWGVNASGGSWNGEDLRRCVVNTVRECEVALSLIGVGFSDQPTQPLAFITGSHAYGCPTSDSDVDLVILCDKETELKLIKLSDNKSIPVRYGNLNICTVTSTEEYTAWSVAKDILCGKPGSTKEERVDIHKQCLAAVGLPHRRLKVKTV